VSVDLCQCHGGPLSWCPTYRDRNVTTASGPTISYLGEPPVGEVFQTYHASECGICGGPIVVGEQVVRLPAPTWARDMAHALCPS
jgi:hypothetical protein